MADLETEVGKPDYSDIAEQIASGLLKIISTSGVQKMLVSAHVEGRGAELSVWTQLLETIGLKFGHLLVTLEEPIMPIFAGFVAAIVNGMFETSIPDSAFTTRSGGKGERAGASGLIVDAYMKALIGDGSVSQEDGTAGARRVAAAGVHAALEGWFNAVVPELLSDFLPEIGHFTGLTDLSEEVISALGIGRLVRRAMSPLIDATATVPMERHVHKTYRQTLLGSAEAIRQVARGRWTKERAIDELAMQGYSDERAEALFNAAARFLSVDDAMVLARAQVWTRDRVREHRKDAGDTDELIDAELLVVDSKRQLSFLDDSVAALKRAYADRDLTDAEFSNFLRAIYSDASDLAAVQISARTVRDLNVKHLSHSEIKDAVKGGILATIDYRRWLAREGYPNDEATVLELLLRAEIDKELEIEAERKKIADERAAEQKRRDDEKQKRIAEVEAQRALVRRGPLSELRRAVARGLIPMARLVEVLSAEYDDDTVQIFVDATESDRVAYVAEQQKRKDAELRAAQRNIDVGALEQAVLNDVLTVDQFRAQLDTLKFAPADADILTSTLAARKKDVDDARARRRQADEAAANKQIDLGRFEQLVRRGIRSFADYDALLASLGFEEGARAGMADLLRAKVADDEAAAKTRKEAEDRLRAKGLSLEQLRRGVVLGAKTADDYQAFLIQQGFTADAQIVLMAELRDDVAQAEAARKRRELADQQRGGRRLPIAALARAARLGVVTVDVYRARLEADGWTRDDIAIEMDLLAFEIAQVQHTRTLAGGTTPTAAAPGLTLPQLAKAVVRGVATVDTYRARAVALGYNQADVATLVALLHDEVTSAADAEARRGDIDGDLATRNLSLGELEALVKGGQTTLSDYTAALVALGYGADDAQLLTNLLASKMAAASGSGQ